MANGVFFSNLVRLYHAVFDRESDLEGLGFWASNLAQGNITFADVADEFMASDEFIAKYGDASDEDFVNLLYENVLHRKADDGGLEFWLEVLENGNLRRHVLLEFSDSDEFVAEVEENFADELEEAEQEEALKLVGLENALEHASENGIEHGLENALEHAHDHDDDDLDDDEDDLDDDDDALDDDDDDLDDDDDDLDDDDDDDDLDDGDDDLDDDDDDLDDDDLDDDDPVPVPDPEPLALIGVTDLDLGSSVDVF